MLEYMITHYLILWLSHTLHIYRKYQIIGLENLNFSVNSIKTQTQRKSFLSMHVSTIASQIFQLAGGDN